MREKAFLTSCLVVAVSLFSSLSYPTLKDSIGANWTTVKRGTSAVPVEFTSQGQILFHEGQCSLHITDEDETTTEVQFSTLSPDAEYRVVIADVYDFQPAYFLDVKKCGVMHLPLPRYFQPWASWAPDGEHVIFYTDYEASPQLWLLRIDTGQIFEVHRSGLATRADTCCGLNEWAPKSGVAYLKPESLRWVDKANFSFRLEIFCNPYSEEGGWPCGSGDNDRARAAQDVSVNLDTSTVTSEPRIKLPVHQGAKK